MTHPVRTAFVAGDLTPGAARSAIRAASAVQLAALRVVERGAARFVSRLNQAR